MWSSWAKKAQDALATTQDALANASGADFSELVEKAKVAAKDVADKAGKVSADIQAEYKRTFEDLDCSIFTARPGMLIMEFPTEDRIDRLSTRLNNDHANSSLILNLSGAKYHTTKFNGKITDVALRGLPEPPLELLMDLCVSSHEWLAADASNVIVVNDGADGYSRAVFFMSCLLVFRGLCATTADASREVCDALEVSEESTVIPSQRRYLAYFQQCLQGTSPSSSRVRFHRAQLSSIPKFEPENAVVFRPYIEVWAGGELAYSSTTPPQGDGTSLTPMGYGAADVRASFQFPADLCIAGDVLFKVWHAHSSGQPQIAFAMACHTGLLPDGLQLAKHELDHAINDDKISQDFILDVLFEETKGADSEAPAAIYEKARELSKRLVKEQTAAAAKAASSSSARDEFAELEEALLRGSGESTPRSTPSASASLAGKTAAPAKPAEAVTGSPTANGGPAFAPPDRMAPKEATPAAAAAASTDIDDLFNEFDAVLEDPATTKASACKPAEASASKAAEVAAPPFTLAPKPAKAEEEEAAPAPAMAPKPAEEAAPAPAAAKPAEEPKTSTVAVDTKPVVDTTPAKGADDPFGDVDSFLDDLDKM